MDYLDMKPEREKKGNWKVPGRGKGREGRGGRGRFRRGFWLGWQSDGQKI